MPAEKPKVTKAKKTSAKVMDVSKPGKSTPAATSKPVIVGHKIMKDPMVSKNSTETDEKPEASSAPLPRKVIKPITITEDGELKQSPKTKQPELTVGDAMAAVVKQPEEIPASAEEPEVPAPQEPAKPEVTPPIQESAEESSPETPPAAEKETPTEEPKPAEEESLGSETAVVDAVADQAVGKKKQAPEESEEEKQKRENIEKLIADKKYFVPTGQVTKKRHTQWAIIVLLLLVVALAVVAALDAEVLDIGVKLPFDLIKL